MEQFEIVSSITEIQTIAWGHGIRILPLLMERYGGKPSAWRKKKGKATIRQFGVLYEAELHWFEAHGVGKVNIKIKCKRPV